MKSENCVFQKLYLFHQKINQTQIRSLLENIYNMFCFSTFPYLVYNEESSKRCVEKYNSGNCIAFCYFIKTYLQTNYNIKSFIIGASVPSIFKVHGTPHMCHCAIIIPIGLHEFYLMDCALYFLEPLYCSLKENNEKSISACDVYSHQTTEVYYQLSKCSDTYLDIDYNQQLPDKTLCISCYFDTNQHDIWNYYLIEILNPDDNIGYSFLQYKPNPFMLYTIFEDDIVKLKYKIQFENGKMVITKYPEKDIIYDGTTLENNKQYMSIIEELHPYFLDYMIKPSSS